jgi:hypothetical protein
MLPTLMRTMDTPLEMPAPEPMVQRIVDHLRAAQVGLLTAADSPANNARLLEANAFVWQALTALSRVAAAGSGSGRKVEATRVTAQGARLL